MMYTTTVEQEAAIEGTARALGITPDEVAVALIECGILFLTAKNIGKPLDGLDLSQWPGSERISRVLGDAHRYSSRAKLWTPN